MRAESSTPEGRHIYNLYEQRERQAWVSLGLHRLVPQHLSLLLLAPDSPLEKLPLPTFSLWRLSRHTPGLVHQYLLFPCCCSAAKSYPTLCDPMDCSMSGSSASTISWSSLKFTSFESMMLSNHLILCCPLLLLPSTFPSIRVFSNESALCIWWPKY